eukprot:6256726-Amphidinium_carterae.1
MPVSQWPPMAPLASATGVCPMGPMIARRLEVRVYAFGMAQSASVRITASMPSGAALAKLLLGRHQAHPSQLQPRLQSQHQRSGMPKS